MPDVDSSLRPRDDGSEHHGFRPPLPPPPPLPGMSHDDYRHRLRHHYDNYGDRWFHGAHSWRRFLHSCAPAPWFWTYYPYMYTFPWVFGYYDSSVYMNFGWHFPRWYGHTYYPWWDWCDAPFVYYYYQYPARFSFDVDYDYGYYDDYAYADGYDVVGSDLVVFDRPLGIWVPGHWEEQTVVDTVWVWVPGYYIY